MKVLNAAFYKFLTLEGERAPAQLQPQLQEAGRRRGICGTVLLASEGLNASVAGEEQAVREFVVDLENLLGPLEVKESYSRSAPFARFKVKLKKEIITLKEEGIHPAERTGQRLSAEELKRWLDEGRDFDLLDTRNVFEVRAGTFAKAEDLGLHTFSEFGGAFRREASRWGKRPLVMFCTGGVRCEKSTAVALNLGFEEVYQLDGGILKYFEDCGGAHYQGRCVVFDDRESLDFELQESGQERKDRG